MDKSDFVIQKDVLKRYKGSGGTVVIPEGVTKIGEFAFGDVFCNGNCENLAIHAPAGSFAEQYARENNIKFEAVED